MEEAFYDITKGLALSLLKAAGRLARDEALGDDQERALNSVFEGATAVVLVEVARHDPHHRQLPDRLADEFKRFYRDTWVAETLVDFAISGKEPPLDDLRRRYAAVGNDPDDLPMDFGEAMELLVYEVADRVTKEASRAGSPLANLVVVRQLGELRANQEGLGRQLDLRNETESVAARGAGGEGAGQDEGYERGPDGALYDVLFAGFFLPSGREGRLTRGGASTALEERFEEIFPARAGES